MPNLIYTPNTTYSRVVWGQTTRNGGASTGPYSSFNLAPHVGEALEITARNWQIFKEKTGITRSQLATCSQVHGEALLHIFSGGPYVMEADALVTTTPGVFVGVFTADCTPVLLAVPEMGAAAAIHCGWRSARCMLARKTVEYLCRELNIKPTAIRAWIGASISAKNYEVGLEVAQQFDDQFCLPHLDTNKAYLDVAGAVRAELLSAGILPEYLEQSQYCTYKNDQKFYSYRRDGSPTGRMLSYIGITAK